MAPLSRYPGIARGARIGLRLALVALLLTSAACQRASSAPERYGARIAFRAHTPLHFPDFDLTYQGERRVAPVDYPREFIFHDFRASQGSEVVDVAWSAGAGDIGPAPFTIGGKSFLLELKVSDQLGDLEDNELVVSLATGGP